MKSQKFKPPVFTRRPGGKHTEHDAAWLGNVVSAVKDGTPDAHKRLAVAYHGVPPHLQNDLSEPIAARPSVEPGEPHDVPDADVVRKVDSTPFPTTHGHHPPSTSGKVPEKCGACAAVQPVVKR